MTKILLVDDDLSGSELLKMFLEFEAFEVIAARNLDFARKSLNQSIQIVLLDRHLTRGEDGLVLLDEIRASQTECEPTTPVIITSGDDRDVLGVLERGANTFMHKPFPPSDLVAKIRELV